MGYYINETSNGAIGNSFNDKLNALINDGAITINTPTEFKDNLICLVNNGIFAAAAYAYNENEMNAFLNDDGRNKIWLTWDKVKEFAK